MMFRQLECFVAVAREEHFARAAEACFVSQPALSEALRKLERELGVALVRRRNSFNGLTPEGARLVVWAQRILADHDALKAEVAALRSGLTGELRLGVIPNASPIWSADFARRIPWLASSWRPTCRRPRSRISCAASNSMRASSMPRLSPRATSWPPPCTTNA
jgi:DNA-binding transcriptional LysR family regulator